MLVGYPEVLLVTSTETVQLAPGPAVPPENVMVPAPGLAVSVPPQPLTTLGVPATTIGIGKVSVKVSPVAAEAFALLSMVKVRVVTPPTAM